MPSDVEPRSETGVFSHPETVEVQVFGRVTGGRVNYRSPNGVEREWLGKHDYAHVRTEYDSLGTKLLRDEEGKPDTALTDGETVVGNRIYVRAP